MIEHYILVGQTPVPCELLEWAQWFEESENRIVFQTKVLGLVWVSTIFLGLDHSFARFTDPEAPPILFETMAFWWGMDGHEQRRCSTWMEAEEMHRRMCAHVARPSTVLGWALRVLRENCRQAMNEFLQLFRKPAPASETEEMLDRMRAFAARREDDGWQMY